jgi:hypothetical protein
MPLDRGTPRPMLEDVYKADITRDGKDFAVVRREGGKEQQEYLIGKVLFETPGWINEVCIRRRRRRGHVHRSSDCTR